MPASGTSDPTAWPETINKLKEAIVVAFDMTVSEREDEVKRGEAQRLTVGWNFCTWFLLKVGLGASTPQNVSYSPVLSRRNPSHTRLKG